jgi:hypothetical protein
MGVRDTAPMIIRALLTAALVLAVGATATAAPRVYYRVPTGQAKVEPTRIEFSDLTLSRIAWDGWGNKRATGTGRARINTCVPSCAGGDIIRGTATLKVFHRHREGNRRFYGCLTGRVRAEGRTSRVIWPPGCSR